MSKQPIIKRASQKINALKKTFIFLYEKKLYIHPEE